MLESVTTSSYFFLTKKKIIFIKPAWESQSVWILNAMKINIFVKCWWSWNQIKTVIERNQCFKRFAIIWLLLINKIFWPLKTGHNVQITTVPLARIKNLSLRPSLKMSFMTTGIWYTTPIVSRISILSLYHIVISGMNISL